MKPNPKTAENPTAFPVLYSNCLAADRGMTLRDYFAAKIAQGIAANNDFCQRVARWAAQEAPESEDAAKARGVKFFAKHCYQIADELLAERAKGTEETK